MSSGTRSKRAATHETDTPAKVAKLSNHVEEVVDEKSFATPSAAGKTKGKGEALCRSVDVP